MMVGTEASAHTSNLLLHQAPLSQSRSWPLWEGPRVLESQFLVEGQCLLIAQEHLEADLREGPVMVFACQAQTTFEHQGGYAPTLVFLLHLQMLKGHCFSHAITHSQVAPSYGVGETVTLQPVDTKTARWLNHRKRFVKLHRFHCQSLQTRVFTEAEALESRRGCGSWCLLHRWHLPRPCPEASEAL